MNNKIILQISLGQGPDECELGVTKLFNKRIVVERLRQTIADKNKNSAGIAKTQNWLENYKIVRGNPVRVYEGMEFRLRG